MSYKFILCRFARTASVMDLQPGAHIRAIRSKARAFELRRLGVIR